MILTINEALPSWNTFYSGKHWIVRKRQADLWHELVKWELMTQRIPRTPFTKPVNITVTVYYKNLRVIADADNVCAKLAIDGLKDWVLTDDSHEYVASVTTKSRLDRKHPRTEIIIEETK